MGEEDIRRFEELEKKMDNGTATKEELEERDMLWTLIQLEEVSGMKNTAQFGY